MKKALIFDLDGTILYTLDDLTDAVNHGLEENGYPNLFIDDYPEIIDGKTADKNEVGMMMTRVGGGN